MDTIDNKIPIIEKVICIVDKENSILAAVISSYFNDQNSYFPMFAFPHIDVAEADEKGSEDDDYIARAIGCDAAVLINNALARMGGCDVIIMAGLNNSQKSYVRLYKKTVVIEIKNLADIEEKLLSFSKEAVLECKSEDILEALFLAKKTNRRLCINENAEKISAPVIEKGKGVIILEKSEEVFSIVAVNYAHSVSANLFLVDAFSKEEKRGAERNIQKWRESKSYNKLGKVINRISERVGTIPFSDFTYATFFTTGLPYSLGIKNIIPCSYVHLSLRPDFFIFNSIIFEKLERFNSATIFSPGFFGDDEETNSLIDLFQVNNYYVRSLKDKNATVRNLDFYAQYFPYDVLHICTHGGEVDGYSVVEEFTDRNGLKHSVEYDEVIGFAPVPGKDLIELHRKVIFRKFDTYNWMSEELKKQKIPGYVYEDMRKSMFKDKKSTKNLKRIKKDKIPTSCAIACIDSIHQGMFRILASHSSPLVFNNACWSWSEVATFFLASGARGYVGTLWEIGNSEAVVGAKIFYKNLFGGNTMLESIFESINAIKNTNSEDIYIFWGLHFSTLSPARDRDSSRYKVYKELLRSSFGWYRKIETTKNTEVKKNSIDILTRISEEVENNFDDYDLEKLDNEVRAKVEELSRKTFARNIKREEPCIEYTSSVDRPNEFRKK